MKIFSEAPRNFFFFPIHLLLYIKLYFFIFFLTLPVIGMKVVKSQDVTIRGNSYIQSGNALGFWLDGSSGQVLSFLILFYLFFEKIKCCKLCEVNKESQTSLFQYAPSLFPQGRVKRVKTLETRKTHSQLAQKLYHLQVATVP